MVTQIMTHIIQTFFSAFIIFPNMEQFCRRSFAVQKHEYDCRKNLYSESNCSICTLIYTISVYLV